MTQQLLILVGHLGGDPEMRFTAAGVPVTNFSLATNRSWKDGDGEKQEETTWWRISAWRGLAELCNQYLSKGRQVYVEGRMNSENGNPRVWIGSDGEARASYEVTAQNIRFLGGKGQGGSAGVPESAPGESKEDDSDDIPF